MIRNNDDFFTAVERATPKLTVDERKDLQGFLSSTPFLNATKLILEEADQMKNSFLRMNLGTPDGIYQASRLQGRIDGMLFTFGLLVEEALKEDKDNDPATVA